MWLESQRRAHEAYWPEVDRVFSSLPPRLFRRAKLLEYDLGLRYSATGQFRHAFMGADQFPILSICGWLLDDLGMPSAERDDAERRLFLVSVLLAARVQTMEGITDPSSFSDDGQVALLEFFSARVRSEFARLLPSDSQFWEGYEALLIEDLERQLERRERRARVVLDDEPDAYLHGRWSAPAKLLALAVTELTDATDTAAAMGAMLDALALAFQIRDDVETMDRDLQLGRITYPIAVVARAAQIPLSPPPEPGRMLGAMVVTRSLPAILAKAEALALDSERRARELGLPTVGSYLDEVHATFAQRTNQVSGTDGPSPTVMQRAVPLMRMFEPTVPKALAMAERFLLSERTFRESWETHREGMFGAQEVCSRYPAGLILEILHGRGHDVSRETDDFLAFTVANDFRYYDHPWSDADTDTVGVFLRLRRHATAPDAYEEALARILGCLDRQIRASGAVPVWITGCDGAEDTRPPILALGEGCGTVAAHLLIGLMSVEGDRYREAVESGTAQLLARVRDVGLGANVNYPPLYALAVFFRLLSCIEQSEPGPGLAAEIGATRTRLLTELETRTQRQMVSPQEAALAAIACHDADQPKRIDRRWVTTVLKQQRSDGSWIGEPFAAAPNRGGWVSWYSSTMLTSALCYEALAGSSALDSRSLITA